MTKGQCLHIAILQLVRYKILVFREQGAGSREQGAGSREQGAGSREKILFTSLVKRIAVILYKNERRLNKTAKLI